MSRPANSAERAAAELLLRQRMYSLRVDPMHLVHERSIRFDTFENYCALTRMTMRELSSGGGTIDGLTVRFKKDGEASFLVLYHGGAKGSPRLRFTLAHELGHIYLAHDGSSAAEEREANRFAAALLIPRVLAGALKARSGGLSADELAEAFGVSRTVAALRLRSLEEPLAPSEADLALLSKLGGFLPELRGPVVTV